MSDIYADDASLPLINGAQLFLTELPVVKRGYDIDATNDLLRSAQATIDRLFSQLEETVTDVAAPAVAAVGEASESAATAATRILASAERIAEEVLSEARSEARRMVEEATAYAKQSRARTEREVAEALADAHTVQERTRMEAAQTRRTVEAELDEARAQLVAVRDETRLVSEAAALEAEVAALAADRDRAIAELETELAGFQQRAEEIRGGAVLALQAALHALDIETVAHASDIDMADIDSGPGAGSDHVPGEDADIAADIVDADIVDDNASGDDGMRSATPVTLRPYDADEFTLNDDTATAGDDAEGSGHHDADGSDPIDDLFNQWMN